ncbi:MULTISPECIES: triacylglycerol lipase [unclassified Rhizobacter]|uniref:esterase/lipase family protein n=1 Tax=unclassified Rhizobacter TaxID=2640088 RepID=UPI0006FA80BE|nr:MULTISPECIES: hypothetical protein [unclassified Rhizobacter]KQU80430.1 hypothetical protein ASC88_17575 [Rhizobacter sp. Root29]KQW13927.1 hypothetical protein ASC98_17705 [Rhizobacter sp. Root1238]
MQALFVHGLGRTPFSGLPLMARLRRAGIRAQGFGYLAACEDVETICARLTRRLIGMAQSSETTSGYAVVGHSLGGVLLRDALAALPDGVLRPRHVFLLGSPQKASRLAQALRERWIFRIWSGDCGRLLGSSRRMAGIAALSERTTAIVGTGSLPVLRRWFGDEANDGVVSESEVSAAWISDWVRLPQTHTWLPSSREVSQVILDRLRRTAA